MQTENRKCYFSLQEGHGSVWWFHWLIPPCLISAEHLGSNDTNISNKKKKKGPVHSTNFANFVKA